VHTLGRGLRLLFTGDISTGRDSDAEVNPLPVDTGTRIFMHRWAWSTKLVILLIVHLKIQRKFDDLNGVGMFSLYQTARCDQVRVINIGFYALYGVFAFFFSVMTRHPAVDKWTRRQFEGTELAPRHRAMDFFETSLGILVMIHNSIITTCVVHEQRSEESLWILAVMTQSMNLSMIGLFIANAGPSRRYDLVVHSTLYVMLYWMTHRVMKGNFTLFYRICFDGHAKMLFWLWFIPIVIGALVRSTFQKNTAQVESAKAERLANKLANKLKRF